MALAPGTRIGAYEVVSALGAGGMGEVYLARDGRLHRDVAVKIIPDAFAADRERLVRFEREAQVLASLNHTNIAHLYGLEDHGSSRALVMEYVAGRTLAQVLADGPRGLPLDETLAIARQIADGLEAAHERGIVHRDLKPGNVMLTDDDRVKILDFGLARVSESGVTSDPSNSPTVTIGTQAGVILGTVAYMSPEQAKGRAADKRSDIWSFGCVIYEMLTGARAFTGDSTGEILANVLKSDVDWSRLPVGLPPALRVCLERCLTRDRHERLGDISTVQFLLSSPAGIATAAPIAAIGRATWRERTIWVTTAFLLAAVVGIAAWRLKPVPVEPRVTTRFQHALEEGQTFFGGQRATAISPDGTTIAYVANRRLYVRPLADLEAHPIAGGDDDPVYPVFSPDGLWIAYGVRGKDTLSKVPTAGGQPETLAQLPGPPGDISWSGGSIVFGLSSGEHSGVFAVPEAGGALKQLASVDAAAETASQPELVGDTHVLFTLRRLEVPAAAGGNSLVIDRIGGGDRRTAVPNATSGRVLPTGHLAYISAGSLRVVPFDLARLEVTGEPVVLQMGVSGTFSVSRNGTLVYAPTTPVSRTMVWLDRRGKEQPFPLAPGGYYDVRVSPDGKLIALCSGADIHIWSMGQETLTNLSLTPGSVEYNPAWTADSRHVVFDSSDGSARRILRKAADGSGPTEEVVNAPGYPETLSPDARFLVYHTQSNVAMLQPLGPVQPARRLVPGTSQVFNAEISRDGRWIAYQSNASGRHEVYVHPFPAMEAGHWQVSQSGGAHPLWGPNGKELFYIDAAGMLTSVPFVTSPTFVPGKPAPLFPAGQYFFNVARNYDVTLDGNRFLFVKTVSQGAARPTFTVVTDWFEEVKARSGRP